jgi:ribosome maturation factor RimP
LSAGGTFVQSAMCRVSPDIFLYPQPSDAQVTPPLLTPDVLRPTIAALGFELVDVRVGGSTSRRVVRIRIDVPGGGQPGHGVTSSDCQRVSRALEEALEAAGAVGPQWELEVSSPGIERPVRFLEHWQRYVGREIRLKAMGVPGVRTARIMAVPDAAHVTLDMGGETATLALEAIKEATLVHDWSRQGNREAGEP